MFNECEWLSAHDKPGISYEEVKLLRLKHGDEQKIERARPQLNIHSHNINQLR